MAWYFGVSWVITRDSLNISEPDIILLDLKRPRWDYTMKKRHKIHLRIAILGGSLHFGDLEVKHKVI